MNNTNANVIQNIYSNSFGGGNLYRHMLSRRVVYTEGVKAIGETGAYWLIDAIVSYQSYILNGRFPIPGQDDSKATANDFRDVSEGMQFWTLSVKDGSASLTMNADIGKPWVIKQDIEFTDFPEGDWSVWVGYGQDPNGKKFATIYLPNEH